MNTTFENAITASHVPSEPVFSNIASDQWSKVAFNDSKAVDSSGLHKIGATSEHDAVAKKDDRYDKEAVKSKEHDGHLVKESPKGHEHGGHLDLSKPIYPGEAHKSVVGESHNHAEGHPDKEKMEKANPAHAHGSAEKVSKESGEHDAVKKENNASATTDKKEPEIKASAAHKG